VQQDDDCDDDEDEFGEVGDGDDADADFDGADAFYVEEGQATPLTLKHVRLEAAALPISLIPGRRLWRRGCPTGCSWRS
jgi:hypothetical protein